MSIHQAAVTGRKQTPFVSVIIPCFNNSVGLRDTLASLSCQDYPRERWEVVVIDNNSTDDTFRVGRSFETVLPLFTLERELRRGSYVARNKGIKLSRGEILAFIDADMTVGRSWISRGVNKISRDNCDYVGCRVDIHPSRWPPNLWEWWDMKVGFPIRSYMEADGFAGAGNLFVRRTVFEKVGLFDEALISGGDHEFGNRVRDAGFSLCYDDANPMKHPARSNLKSHWTKKVRTGKGVMDLCHFYPEKYTAPKIKSILALFIPMAPRRILEISDLSPRNRLGVWVVANCARFAYAYGQLARYVHQKTGVSFRTRQERLQHM